MDGKPCLLHSVFLHYLNYFRYQQNTLGGFFAGIFLQAGLQAVFHRAGETGVANRKGWISREISSGPEIGAGAAPHGGRGGHRRSSHVHYAATA